MLESSTADRGIALELPLASRESLYIREAHSLVMNDIHHIPSPRNASERLFHDNSAPSDAAECAHIGWSQIPPGRDLRAKRGATYTLAIRSVAGCVAELTGVSVAAMASSRRGADVLAARWAAIYAAKYLTGAPLREIGRFFGTRCHQTVRNVLRRIENTGDSVPPNLSLEALVSFLTGRLPDLARLVSAEAGFHTPALT